MKKTYINPEIIVVRLMPKTAMLSVVSNPDVGFSTSDDDAVNAGSVDTKGITNINIWDDDDEW